MTSTALHHPSRGPIAEQAKAEGRQNQHFTLNQHNSIIGNTVYPRKPTGFNRPFCFTNRTFEKRKNNERLSRRPRTRRAVATPVVL